MTNADKRKQAEHCLRLAILYCLQGDTIYIKNNAVDAHYLAGGLHEALLFITVLKKTMKQLLIVENRQSTKGTYMPVKNTTKNDCYKALWQIQEMLGTRILEIGREAESDDEA